MHVAQAVPGAAAAAAAYRPRAAEGAAADTRRRARCPRARALRAAGCGRAHQRYFLAVAHVRTSTCGEQIRPVRILDTIVCSGSLVVGSSSAPSIWMGTVELH